MNNNYGIPIALLRFLSACIYGNAKTYYASLNEDQRAELESQGNSFGLTAWFYRYLYDVLPEGKRSEFQKIYQARQMKALIGAQELKRLYRVFAAHELRFVPIKGADLCYRLYPDTALRSFVDWDIWFHPDDSEKALAVLAEDGWKVPRHFSKDHASVRKSGAHHFAAHIRGQNMIEPHFTLPNIEIIDPYELWKHTVEYPNGDGQRLLSPEMNLLMLTRHAAEESYYHTQIPQLLTDAAMVMKENVDFERLRELATSWHLSFPGDLLAAFPEFFPADKIEGFKANAEKVSQYRSIFELRGRLGKQDKVALTLSRYEIHGHVTRGVLRLIRVHDPALIRRMYRLPPHGAWARLMWAYIQWFWTKSLRAKPWIRRDRQLQEYIRLVEDMESCKTTE